MKREQVLTYFESGDVIDHYARAASHIGLWRSEEKIFKRLFKPEDSILELGCGVGRISIGLYELGYKNLLATDYARKMIERARHLSKILEYPIPFRVGDATRLEFEANVFDGAIFGFNGLMQIPEAALRKKALEEIFRVLKPQSWFVFTTHDRVHSKHQEFWKAEAIRWKEGSQNPQLEVFGDRLEVENEGVHFMHVPSAEEIERLLESVGFRLEASVMRSQLSRESKDVVDFSDDCRFWVVEKPSV